MAGADGVELELIFGQEASAWADLFAIIDVVAGQLLERPIVERLVVGFEGDQVVVHQIVEAIRQFPR